MPPSFKVPTLSNLQKAAIAALVLIFCLNLNLTFSFINSSCQDSHLETESDSHTATTTHEDLLLRKYAALKSGKTGISCEPDVSYSGMEFQWNPKPISRPFEQRAVVTFYEADESRKEYDTDFADVAILVYTFMNLVDKGDAEVVVAYTGFMPWEKQMSLTRLGARLLHLPQLIVPSTDRWSCISCFSKLYLFGLEGIYTDILYVNSNMLLSPTLPLSFLFLFSAPENPKFFGAVQSLALADGNFDTSVLLFKPLKTRMAKLVQRAGKFNKTVDGGNSEHDLLNDYFNGPQSPSCTTWTPLPDLFNIQHSNIRDSSHLNKAYMICHTFWKAQVTHAPLRPIYNRWRETVHALFDFEEAQFGRSVVGRIPDAFFNLQIMIRANTFRSTFVILSIMTTNVETHVYARTVRNRAKYCELHPGVYHWIQQEVYAKNAVWQKVYTNQVLMEQYDWVWLLDARDAMIMNGSIDLRVLVGKLLLEEPKRSIDVIIARDFNEMNAGSFFIRSSEWAKQLLTHAWLQDEPSDHWWQEQGSLMTMRDENRVGFKDHLMELEQQRSTLFNAYFFGPGKHFQDGDFLLHAPSQGWGGLYNFIHENNLREVMRRSGRVRKAIKWQEGKPVIYYIDAADMKELS